VLPNMRADLRWSFATAGALNTANAAGYLIGALIAAAAARWFGERRVFLCGLALTGLRRAHRGRIGPLMAGVLADASGGVPVGLAIGAVLLALGGLTALLHDRPRDIGTPRTRENHL
jgi:cyanate permease